MSTDTGDEPVADFTALDGVGPKTAQALGRAGVSTMSQLAKSDVYTLAERLENVGAPVPVGRIISQRWLFQAWDLAGSSESPESGGGDPPEPEGADDTSTDDAVEHVGNGGEDQEWTEQASFIVSFDHRTGGDGPSWQTRIWDTKAMAEEVLAGIDPDGWATLIVARLESTT